MTRKPSAAARKTASGKPAVVLAPVAPRVHLGEPAAALTWDDLLRRSKELSARADILLARLAIAR